MLESLATRKREWQGRGDSNTYCMGLEASRLPLSYAPIGTRCMDRTCLTRSTTERHHQIGLACVLAAHLRIGLSFGASKAPVVPDLGCIGRPCGCRPRFSGLKDQDVSRYTKGPYWCGLRVLPSGPLVGSQIRFCYAKPAWKAEVLTPTPFPVPSP